MSLRKTIQCLTTGLLMALLNGPLFSQETDSRLKIPLYYDPATGNLTLDATEVPTGQIYGYSMELAPLGFDPVAAGMPQFRPDNFTPFLETLWSGADDYSAGEVNFNGIPAGVYSLGDLLPPGLERETGSIIGRHLSENSWSGGVLDALGTGYRHPYDFIYGKSPFPPLNGDEGWSPGFDRWAESVVLLYDLTNGSLAIDSTGEGGGAISTFLIRFDDDAPFNVENWTPVSDNSNFDKGQINEIFTAGLPEGRYELGKILPAGLTADDVMSHLEDARFVGQPGHGNPFSVSAHGEPLAILVIPEPSGWAIASCAVIFLALIRRTHQD